MTSPIIGVTTFISSDGLRLPETYSTAIAGEGGAPVILAKVENESLIKRQIESIDGLLLSGGDDIEPAFFGESPHQKMGAIEPGRDLYEMKLIEYALEAGKPILGICRGAQILNVQQGGTMYQDIYSQHGDSTIKHNQDALKDYLSHNISVAEGTKLHAILGETEIRTNSFHHQANKCAADSLTVSAMAEDGIIEAVESGEHKFVLGVQWHPEGSYLKDESSKKIFRAFIKAAAES